MPKKLTRLISGQSPTMLDAEVANDVIEAINGAKDSEGKAPIKVTVEDGGKMIVELSGYVETDFEVCDGNNNFVTKTFLVKK